MGRMTPAEVCERLEEVAGPCILCERRCGAMRQDGERGWCGLADEVFVYNRLLHVGEEAPLVPSYAIFLTGCSMACSFCSEAEHLQPPFALAPTDPEILAMKVAVALTGPAASARNINFVGGEPSIVLPFIARFVVALDALLPERPPLLLNTNGYMTPEALALATHLCEIFVVDLKFGQDACAQAIADTPVYTESVRRNLRWLHDGRAQGAQSPSTPLMPVSLWVRHLLMPDHLACCTVPSLQWLADNTPEAKVNVMPAFHPFGLPDNSAWRSLSEAERAEGRQILDAVGLEEAYYDGRRHRRG